MPQVFKRPKSFQVKYALEHLYGVTVSPKSIESMMGKIDIDGDGFISFEEWYAYLVKLLLCLFTFI